MLLAVDRVDHVEVVVSLLMDFKMPTEAKELDLMEFGNADNSQKSPTKAKSSFSFSLISRQSQRLVPYLVASNSCQNVALYFAEGGIVS